MAQFRAALSPRVALVSIMWANNETGVMFPVPELAELAHEQGALFHCDAVQVVGKIPMALSQTRIDMLSCSAHKFHGPKGWAASGCGGERVFARCCAAATSAWPAGRYGKYQRHCRNGRRQRAGAGSSAGMAQISQLRDRLEQHLRATIPAVTVMGGSQPRVPALSIWPSSVSRARQSCC